jgi:hypothetical protein
MENLVYTFVSVGTYEFLITTMKKELDRSEIVLLWYEPQVSTNNLGARE